MRSSLVLIKAITLAGLAHGSPLARRNGCDTANDWDSQDCVDLAVIFARGTCDSGNIGVWVGCPFRDALNAELGNIKVAFQGVSPIDYPVDLDGYIEDGGPQSCAVSLGRAVGSYASRCPTTKFVVSGWRVVDYTRTTLNNLSKYKLLIQFLHSQGALCAHKSLDPSSALTNEDARKRVIAITTFGDPISVWQDTMAFPTIPDNTQLLSYCEKTTPDPLCTNPLQDLPHDPIAFIDKLMAMWQDFCQADLNGAQKQAVANLVIELPKQASSKIIKLCKDILAGHLRRWMLTPERFLYGLEPNPMVEQAAKDISQLLTLLQQM